MNPDVAALLHQMRALQREVDELRRRLDGQQRRYLSRYRGTVLDNIDPLGLARLLIEVPDVPSSAMSFALPSAPYFGPQVGFHFTPPIGSNVWVEFEDGDPTRPVWVGGFWVEGELPLEDIDPQLQILRTEGITVLFNDTPEAGLFSVSITPPFVDDPITLTFDSAGAQLIVPPASFLMTPANITQEIPPSTITLSEAGIEVTSDDVNVQAAEIDFTGNFTVNGAVEMNGLDISLSTEGGAIELTSTTGVTINAGLDVEIAGTGVEVTGLVNVGPIMNAELLNAELFNAELANVELLNGELINGEVMLEDGMPVLVVPL